MSEQDTQTPAELAARIGNGLAALAKAAAEAGLECFAAQLATMAADQGLLAAALAVSEAPRTVLDAAQIAGETEQLVEALGTEAVAELQGPRGPIQAGIAMADREALTWRAIPKAVDRLARMVEVPAPEDATLVERLELAADVAAVRQLQQVATALNAFIFETVRAAKMRGRIVVDEQKREAPEPQGLQVAFVALQAAIALADSFADIKEAEAPETFARILSALSNVQRGVHDPLFAPVVRHATAATQTDAGFAKALAAAAMDAWQKAGRKREAASEAVASLLAGVRRNHGGTQASVTAKTVAYWRDQAIAGKLKPTEAQGRWDFHQGQAQRIAAEEPDRMKQRKRFEALAKAQERALARMLRGQGSNFTLAGGARLEEGTFARPRRAKNSSKLQGRSNKSRA